MPTVNNNFSTLITAIDTKAQSLAASTTDPKDLVFLGKTLEALNVTTVVSDVIGQGDTEVARIVAQGNTSVAAVAAQGSGYASLADPTFTGTMNAGNAILSGNLTVNGTTTTINTATLDVEDKNITVAKGAADSAAANGGGLTVDGAGATFNYASTGDKWTTNKGLDVGGTLDIEEVFEKVQVSTTTSGTITFPVNEYGVRLQSVNQTANRTIDFTNVNANLAIGQSVTVALLASQGSTAYYLNAFHIDGTASWSGTLKWQGGSAPTSGNASSVDSYSFTIIKTASATFTVLASLAAFA